MITVDGDIFLDASVSESYTRTANVTSYPVESGGAIADHVQIQPLVITIACLVSDSPIGEVQARRESEGTQRPSLAAYDQLVALYTARRTTTLTTHDFTYGDLILTSITTPVAAETGGALRFDCTFTQVQLAIVASRTVRVDLPRVSKKDTKAKQSEEQPVPKSNQKSNQTVPKSNQSLLRQGLNKVTGSESVSAKFRRKAQ